MIDYEDSKQLWEFGVATLEVSENYAKSRIEYAEALKTLKLALADKYSKDEVDTRMSEEKAYLVLATENETYKKALENLITFEQQYKGLEQIVQTRLALQMLYSSLIKNKVKES